MIKFIDISNANMNSLIMIDSIQALSYSIHEESQEGTISFFLANNYNFNVPTGTKEETIEKYNAIRNILNENA